MVCKTFLSSFSGLSCSEILAMQSATQMNRVGCGIKADLIAQCNELSLCNIPE